MIDVFLVTLLYLLLITGIYFSKKKIDSKDNRLYKIIIISSIVGITIDICQTLLIKNYAPSLVIHSFNKLFLVYINFWTWMFTKYVLNVNGDEKNLNKKMDIISNVFLIIFIFLSLILPIDYYYDGVSKMYSFGPATVITYVSGTVFCFIMSISMLLNYKKVDANNRKKYFPVIIFLLLTFGEVIVQYSHPELTLISPLEAFITILTYFFIENPDVKMIEQLNIARDQADKANSAKSEFLSSMSHEIRTPLNAIVGFSQALSEEELPFQAKEEVKDIMMASETLLDIVNGILDISKIEANKLEIVNTEYSFKQIFDELVSLSKARLGEKPLDFRFNMDESLPKYYYGDKVRVKQVILNLLTNAIKYTKEGWIDFKVNGVNKGGVCRLIISVEDSGIGIKPESIDKLFSKFERLDIEKNNTIEGTGLGLAITKKLIDLMGGKIVVQSVYGQGSKFTIALDQKIVTNPSENLERTQSLDLSALKKIDLTNKRILVVDDNKVNLKVASRLLQDYHCFVDTLDSGQACIDKITMGASYDLILMDDMMPKMSGVETFHNLQNIDGFDTPVIALTANAISGMKEKYLSEGFNDYLSKPIDKMELNRVLNKFLG